MTLPVKIIITVTIAKNNDIPTKNASKLLLILELLSFATKITISHICRFYLLQVQTSKQKQRFLR